MYYINYYLYQMLILINFYTSGATMVNCSAIRVHMVNSIGNVTAHLNPFTANQIRLKPMKLLLLGIKMRVKASRFAIVCFQIKQILVIFIHETRNAYPTLTRHWVNVFCLLGNYHFYKLKLDFYRILCF